MPTISRLAGLLLSVFSLAAVSAPPPVADIVRMPEFTDAKISPDGRHVALAAPTDEQTGLAIIDIANYPKVSVKSAFTMSQGEHVAEIHWVNENRVVFTTTVQRGTLNTHYSSGRLYGMDVNGGRRKGIYGTDFNNDTVFRYFEIIDLLPEDPDWILISAYTHDRDWPIGERLNVNTGKTRRQGVGPLDNGSLFADSSGNIRLAFGIADDTSAEVAYRETVDNEWRRLELTGDGHIEILGFAPDDRTILVLQDDPGAMGLFGLDPDSGEYTPLVVNDSVEPTQLIREVGASRAIIGATFEDGVPRNHFIDESSYSARLYRMLEGAFPDSHVVITSSTEDGAKNLIAVRSDRQPTQFYLFDVEKKQVAHLVGTRNWIDASLMGERKPISFTARDGREIHGYLTLPPGKDPEKLPMVVVVHGGPHGVRDQWSWDEDAQLLATRGYAVLQVNFRGSGGYGYEYEQAGYRNWYTAMQDDITDGVRWAVNEGIADAERLCVYGASFGGYSVLAQLTREPELYKCGFALVGVYDLNLMFEKGDTQETEIGLSLLERYLGTDAAVRSAQSPLNYVDRIKAALYVVHGRADQRAHIAHYRHLIDVLEKHAIPHTKYVQSDERHSFHSNESRARVASELVTFMDKHIGAE